MVTNLHQQRKDALLTEHEVFEQLKGNLSNPKKLIKAVHRLIPQYTKQSVNAMLSSKAAPIDLTVNGFCWNSGLMFQKLKNSWRY